MCPLNIIFLHKFLEYEKLFLQKNLRRKTIKKPYSPQI